MIIIFTLDRIDVSWECLVITVLRQQRLLGLESSTWRRRHIFSRYKARDLALALALSLALALVVVSSIHFCSSFQSHLPLRMLLHHIHFRYYLLQTVLSVPPHNQCLVVFSSIFSLISYGHRLHF